MYEMFENLWKISYQVRNLSVEIFFFFLSLSSTQVLRFFVCHYSCLSIQSLAMWCGVHVENKKKKCTRRKSYKTTCAVSFFFLYTIKLYDILSPSFFFLPLSVVYASHPEDCFDKKKNSFKNFETYGKRSWNLFHLLFLSTSL